MERAASHKWRPRPPHPCANSACGKKHTRCGRYCGACQARLDRHGTLVPFERTILLCDTPACRTKAGRDGRCDRCRLLWKRGVNPDVYHRPYRRLCLVSWCSDEANGNAMCPKHGWRFRQSGNVRMRKGILEPIPTSCVWPQCAGKIHARGLCVEHLVEKSHEVILLREFWPKLPGHRKRYCIGKPGCRRWAILFGRCPDCLYDWQFSLKPPRDFFKRMRAKAA